MKSWYLIYTKPKGEKLARTNLERQKFTTYLPSVLNKIRQRGRTIKSIQPMFPRYLFINLSDQTDDWGPIRSTIGVSNLVRFGMNPAKVPENLIEKLKENESGKGFYELPQGEYQPGDNLIIVDGPFEGYEATLFSQNAQNRVLVLLKIAEKHIKVLLDQSLIEKSS